MARISRRGPDGHGTHVCPSGHAWLGHTRLAILDLSPAGAQPMVSEDGRIVVCFNGEIYNAPAMRDALQSLGHVFSSRTDTEVLIHGYEQWGERELIDRLRGMFAFVLWDSAARRAVAAVDHAGMKPMFWTETAHGVLVASDLDALCDLLPNPPPLDPIGLGHVLCLGYCPPPVTVRQGVYKLGPGEGWVWTPGSRPRSFRHWEPPDDLVDRETPFEPLWESVVHEHTLADVPLGLLLSAGLDSSAVAVALGQSAGRPTCTTLAMPGAADESPLASETAHALRMPHTRVPMQACDGTDLLRQAAERFDEPQGFGALLTMTAAAVAARSTAKTVLAGDGGDEAFAGYAWHRTPPQSAERIDLAAERAVAAGDAPAEIRHRAMASLAEHSFLHAYLQSVMPRFHPLEAAALLEPLGTGYDQAVYAEWLAPHDRPRSPWPRRAQMLDLAGFCAGSILPKLDRATMAVGLELRAPFLDRRILEWALRRPVEPDEFDPGSAKPVLRRYLTDRVPERVLQRDKQGFSLRLGRTDLFTSMLPELEGSRLVRAGALHRDWRSFVGPDVPAREGRAFALCMLCAWAEERL